MSELGIIFISVVGTVFFLGLATFLAVIWLRSKHPKEIGENLDEISGGLNVVRGGLRGMRNGAHFIWCYFLIYSWKARTKIRAYIPGILTVTFLVAGFLTFVEVMLNIVDALVRSGFALHFASHAAILLTAFLSTTKEVLHAFYKNLYLLSFLLVVEAIIALHHLREHKHRHREQKLLVQLLDIFGPLNRVCVYLDLADSTISDEDVREATKRDAIKVFMAYFSNAIQTIFKERGIVVNVCVMEQQPHDHSLRAEFDSSDGRDFGTGFILPTGKGAAGVALSTNKTIYVPNVAYEHAVLVASHTNKVIPRVYYPGANPYKSILCSPIVFPALSGKTLAGGDAEGTVSASNLTGVLNLSSDRSSAFSESDFAVARIGAAILALMYTRGGQ